MLFTHLLRALLPLAATLSAITGVLATPAFERRVSETSLQGRWDALLKQAGKTGVQTLCQAILPHATATKTSIITFNTPITATETAFSTDVATYYTSITEATFTETVLETTTITQVAPDRRGLSEALKKLFKLLFADANIWTIAKCKTITSPLTDAVTSTTTTFAPSIAATVTSTSVTSTTTTDIVTATQTSVRTVLITAVVTSTLVLPNPRICPSRVSAAVPVARFPNTDIFGYDLPVEEGGDASIGVGSETACILACSQITTCTAYFWWPSLRNCYLKGDGWTSSAFVYDSPSAREVGAVAGVLRTTCDGLRVDLADDIHRRCCNN